MSDGKILTFPGVAQVAPTPAPVETEYVNLKDTAKLIREVLKKEFPGIKFSVRGRSYAGGASIDVGWVDGPIEKDVDALMGQFRGADFDGMIDLKSYVTHTRDDGRRVSYAADFIFARRTFSEAFLRDCSQVVAREYGMTPVAIRAYSSGASVDTTDYRRVGQRDDYLWEEVMRRARDMRGA